MIHSHVLARPVAPIEDQERPPNRLSAALRSIGARILSPSKRAPSVVDAAPAWAAELYLDFLDDASLSRGMVKSVSTLLLSLLLLLTYDAGTVSF